MFFPAMSPLNSFLRIHPNIYCVHCQNQAELKDFTRGKNRIENRRQNFIKTVSSRFLGDLLSKESLSFPLHIYFSNPGLKIFLIHLLNGPVYPPYHSVHDRSLPDPRNRGRSRDEREPQRDNIYVEVLSMRIQNLTNPSAVPSSPDRGSSRDNSRNRFRNNYSDKHVSQPRRDSPWNRFGHNSAYGSSLRLSTEKETVPLTEETYQETDLMKVREFNIRRM
jgi:hypothetical protein